MSSPSSPSAAQRRSSGLRNLRVACPGYKAPNTTNTRFFILKSRSMLNLLLSFKESCWASTPDNNDFLIQAYRTIEHLILIFSVNDAGCFMGYGRMCSISDSTYKKGLWGPAYRFLGDNFRVQWLKSCILNYDDCRGIKNELNDFCSCGVARDGQELDSKAGFQLCELMDKQVDWDHSYGTELFGTIPFFESYASPPPNIAPLQYTVVAREVAATEAQQRLLAVEREEKRARKPEPPPDFSTESFPSLGAAAPARQPSKGTSGEMTTTSVPPVTPPSPKNNQGQAGSCGGVGGGGAERVSGGGAGRDAIRPELRGHNLSLDALCATCRLIATTPGLTVFSSSDSGCSCGSYHSLRFALSDQEGSSPPAAPKAAPASPPTTSTAPPKSKGGFSVRRVDRSKPSEASPPTKAKQIKKQEKEEPPKEKSSIPSSVSVPDSPQPLSAPPEPPQSTDSPIVPSAPTTAHQPPTPTKAPVDLSKGLMPAPAGMHPFPKAVHSQPRSPVNAFHSPSRVPLINPWGYNGQTGQTFGPGCGYQPAVPYQPFEGGGVPMPPPPPPPPPDMDPSMWQGSNIFHPPPPPMPPPQHHQQFEQQHVAQARPLMGHGQADERTAAAKKSAAGLNSMAPPFVWREHQLSQQQQHMAGGREGSCEEPVPVNLDFINSSGLNLSNGSSEQKAQPSGEGGLEQSGDAAPVSVGSADVLDGRVDGVGPGATVQEALKVLAECRLEGLSCKELDTLEGGLIEILFKARQTKSAKLRQE
ncbi:unnamed protein product [Vitrella brassicaformis CCMP3155]|uniref:YTH domain-containing protein n=1 Tax=Vitrella brassicaformis (strain CCMP3155) TaxID=1169540 RepID=A0A0G4FVA7_VITBC|nr:unnamed protein product [Vitrella brassicaformis CCMP3155]|eukprot:CEM19019.1 unnamed protein product [Vitrella brassicaformis CCMP3155]